jgi:hypothetical protein
MTTLHSCYGYSAVAHGSFMALPRALERRHASTRQLQLQLQFASETLALSAP